MAVGVLDILPSGVSSVYLFYDPDMKHLVLGKYSALCEIDWCRDLGLDYYYMGFYIHTCPKMKYKGDYAPSELLCPTSLEWFPLASCVHRLDRFRFTPFREDLAVRREALRLTLAHSASSVALQRDTEMAVSSAVQQGPSSNDLPISACEPADPSPEERILLEQFSLSSDGCDISVIPLDLNHSYRLFCIDDITVEGEAMLRPLLESWIALSGEEMAQKIIIKLR